MYRAPLQLNKPLENNPQMKTTGYRNTNIGTHMHAQTSTCEGGYPGYKLYYTEGRGSLSCQNNTGHNTVSASVCVCVTSEKM